VSLRDQIEPPKVSRPASNHHRTVRTLSPQGRIRANPSKRALNPCRSEGPNASVTTHPHSPTTAARVAVNAYFRVCRSRSGPRPAALALRVLDRCRRRSSAAHRQGGPPIYRLAPGPQMGKGGQRLTLISHAGWRRFFCAHISHLCYGYVPHGRSPRRIPLPHRSGRERAHEVREPLCPPVP